MILSCFGESSLVRARPFHVQSWLSEEEFRKYEDLYLSVVGGFVHGNHGRCFRLFLRAVSHVIAERDELRRELRVEDGRSQVWLNETLRPPKATRGPVSIEVEDPEDILDYEED